MDFRIADTFTDSMSRLTGDEQKAVKTTAFDLQLNPAHPSLQFHKLDKAKDRRFSSVRVSKDVRLIVHRTDAGLLLCYVGHHDDAYHWAEKRKLEVHPTTGAAQLVEVRETVVEITVPKYVEAPAESARPKMLFAGFADSKLLSFGVPPEWLGDVKESTEDSILELIDHLPSEAAEALLELATGGSPQASQPRPLNSDPFGHPDAQRRFRVMSNAEELERALEFPWDKWTVFLHPVQRELVERDYSGPARVAGSAGTGKTIVALHRAVLLARSNANARVLLTTFSDALANALRGKLNRLISNEPKLAERIEVRSLRSIAERLYKANIGEPNVAKAEAVGDYLRSAALELGIDAFSQRFLSTEWEQVVDAWGLASWEDYRDVVRLGRKTRLSEKARQSLWAIFDHVRNKLASNGEITSAGMYNNLAAKFLQNQSTPFEFIVVDEAQDVSVTQLRLLAAMGSAKPNGLFFSGDIGQRIFQPPFSWKSLGVDVRGRSHTLKINYRTSHQIRSLSDRLLAPELTDVDGLSEKRLGTTSTFNGPEPLIEIFESEDEEAAAVGSWLALRRLEGVTENELAVFVRSSAQFARAEAAVAMAGLAVKILDENVETVSGHVSVSTMHLAKGLEFRSVVVMACDDEICPLQGRIESLGDEGDLEEIYASERHLLYVACTRARDHLLVTGVEPASEFLDDLAGP